MIFLQDAIRIMLAYFVITVECSCMTLRMICTTTMSIHDHIVKSSFVDISRYLLGRGPLMKISTGKGAPYPSL